MELFFFVLISLFLIASISLGIRSFASKTKEKVTGTGPTLPPGSFGWPIMGETLQFLAANREGAIDHKFISKRTTKYSSKIFKTSIFGTTKKGGFGPRFFGPRFKKRGPKMPNAPFFKNGAKNAKVQPRFENGALA